MCAGGGTELEGSKKKKGWRDRGTGAEHGALQQMQWGVKGFFTAGVFRPGGKMGHRDFALYDLKKKMHFYIP